MSLKDSDCQQNELHFLNISKEFCELDSAVCNKYSNWKKFSDTIKILFDSNLCH